MPTDDIPNRGPNPKVGELWLVREDIGLPQERGIILITRVYETETGSNKWDLKYRAVDGLLDGRVMEKLGSGWLVKRLCAARRRKSDI